MTDRSAPPDDGKREGIVCYFDRDDDFEEWFVNNHRQEWQTGTYYECAQAAWAASKVFKRRLADPAPRKPEATPARAGSSHPSDASQTEIVLHRYLEPSDDFSDNVQWGDWFQCRDESGEHDENLTYEHAVATIRRTE